MCRKTLCRHTSSLILATVACSITVTSAQDKLRTWTDVTGQHKSRAAFVALEDDQVTLRREDGKTVKIPLDRLSACRSGVRSPHGSDCIVERVARRSGSRRWRLAAMARPESGWYQPGDRLARRVARGWSANALESERTGWRVLKCCGRRKSHLHDGEIWRRDATRCGKRTERRDPLEHAGRQW